MKNVITIMALIALIVSMSFMVGCADECNTCQKIEKPCPTQTCPTMQSCPTGSCPVRRSSCASGACPLK